MEELNVEIYQELVERGLIAQVTDEKELKDFIEGFKSRMDAQIPVSSIFPKFSTVVYQSYANGWHPEDFYKGIRGYDKLDYHSSIPS